MKKSFGKSLCLLCLACVWPALSGCGKEKTDAVQQTTGVRVTFFDVGKGDAVLVETGEHALLIDAGYEETAEMLLDYFEAGNIRKLDYLVLTHFDKDHVGGADRILENLEMGEVLQPDYVSDEGQYLEYRALLEERKVEPVLVTETMRFSLAEADFLIYPPQKKSYEEEDNDFSLVISMRCPSSSFLFAGDCEEERLQELLEQNEFDLSHDVLKVPHHGKKEKSSKEFLEAVAPRIAVITCSREEMPSHKILNLLEESGAEVYLTTEGRVTCLCGEDGLEVF